MFVQLFVLACACALSQGLTQFPPYTLSLVSFRLFDDTLTANLIAVDGDVPLLNDPKRHYAEIINVIYNEAISQSGCLRLDYEEEYQRNLNSSAVEAIVNPKEVTKAVNNLIKSVQNNINKIVVLVDSCGVSVDNCDEVVDKLVKDDPESLKEQADVLLAAGEAASVLLAKNDKFLKVAKNLTAHSYVLHSAADLKSAVMAMADLRRQLNAC